MSPSFVCILASVLGVAGSAQYNPYTGNVDELIKEGRYAVNRSDISGGALPAGVDYCIIEVISRSTLFQVLYDTMNIAVYIRRSNQQFAVTPWQRFTLTAVV